MQKIILTTFTDPMMGLSYECEPIFEKLENYYGVSPSGIEDDNSPSGAEDDNKIEFRYVMAGLVRDVGRVYIIKASKIIASCIVKELKSVHLSVTS